MYRFHMKVYGCQMNVYDSDRVRTALIRRGWSEVAEEEADVVVVTGCSVRGKAEQKVWSELGRYADSWAQKRAPRVALTGCIAQSLGKKALSRFSWVRLVSGPRHIGLLPDALERVARDGLRVSLLDDDPREFFDLDEFSMRRDNVFRAYVTIAHGCDNFCSYCIVPYVRGRFFSRPPTDILQEVKKLVMSGAKEITLLGQNVNSYGKDFADGYGFASLLRDVARVDGVERLRFVTSLPQDFTEEIARAMAEEPCICPSLNLPIQAGSDRILRRMNRKYSRAEYFEKVRMIRGILPELGLTSDLIVGFPGETEEDFLESMSALEELRFDLVHTAAYSEREGTPAATLPESIPQDERLSRLARINSLQDAVSLSINKALVGRTFEVLAEGPAPKGEGLLQGRTPTDKAVVFPGEAELAGRFLDVKIREADSWSLRGEIEKKRLK